ncbi:hypothetical protein A1OE_1183 [Candidatus Endolissoclinum faulkneri L2]|uniref:Uncharacterized protein n=1 Tax=Candidatus Endolissoclinum faulkneri L2 TaxID=1193729 RepID=K7ZDA9_9PROT|nr:hypothetical protein A1OE_1183 [Candidatus Endolissoclinum faulkneri L2]
MLYFILNNFYYSVRYQICILMTKECFCKKKLLMKYLK